MTTEERTDKLNALVTHLGMAQSMANELLSKPANRNDGTRFDRAERAVASATRLLESLKREYIPLL